MSAEAPASDAGLFDVGDGHQIHVESFGNPEGLPVVFLHGGPGSGCQPAHRRLFDPALFHVIFFDQRGAGRSRPHGARHANTTAHLIADMEKIRAHFSIEQWLVVGGSWGATLALAYAQAHPEAVLGMALRSVFLGTRAEVEWAFGPTLQRFHPALHEDFLHFLPPQERDDPLDSYWARILSPDPARHRPAALMWHDTERALSELIPPSRPAAGSERPLPSSPFMEAHYFQNDCFLKPGQLLEEAARLAELPVFLIQARYDLLCPPATTHALARQLPQAQILNAEAAGHSLSHPPVEAALVEALAALQVSLAA